GSVGERQASDKEGRMFIGKSSLAALGVVAVVGGGAAGAAHAHGGASPALFRAHPRLIRFLHRVTDATATVRVGGATHTVRLDHGTVLSVGSARIVLREGGTATVTIPVSTATHVRLDGQSATLSQIRRGDVAYALRVDGGAARGVRAL